MHWGPGSAWSYWRHSHQSAAFEAPADSQAGTGYHSGRHTPCAVSLTLRRRRHVGRTPGRPDRSGMCEAPAPPQFPAPRGGALISRARIQKRPSTHPEPAFPGSAPSRLRLTGKGLLPLSSLSFSRSAFCSGYPEGVSLRRVGVATARLPTPACVTRTCRAFHPIGSACAELWSLGPAGGLAVLPLRTRFESHHSAGLHGRACPARPHSRAGRGGTKDNHG